MDNSAQQKPKTNQTLRTLLMATVFLLAIFLIYFLVSSNSNGTKITLDLFYNHLDAGKIESVELDSKTINVEYKSGKKAWFYSRESVENAVLAKIDNYNAGLPADEATVEVVPGTTSSFSWWSLIYLLVIVGSTVLLFVWITRQIRGANSKSFDFVKNKARIASSQVKFKDVAGADEEKQEVSELVEFLKNPEKFDAIGARIPKGVLLVGAPGTGKTLLAKAIAGEASVPFFTISGSDFMELFVGVGASRVRDLFAQAKRVKPCIVFIDEIDAVGRQRGAGVGGGNDEREQTLNQLLVQMDGFEPNEGILVIAATNRVDILDPALLRPGRFDRQVYMHVPDVRGREEILKVHAKNKKFAEGVDLKIIARVTSGFTGADLENLLNEAAILAARSNRKLISQNDLAEGIDKVTLGPQKRSRLVSERDKKITAFHEAGHATVQYFCENSDPVHEVSIIPRGMAGGYTVSRPENDNMFYTKRKLLDTIMMLVAGRAAEEIFLDDITPGASSDIQKATEIARDMVTRWGMSDKIGLVNLAESEEIFFGRDYKARASYSDSKASVVDEEIKQIIDKCKEGARAILLKHKAKVKVLVDVLFEKETVFTDSINKIFQGKSKKTVIEYIDKQIEKEKEIEKQADATKVESSVVKPTVIKPITVKCETVCKTENPENKTVAKTGIKKPSSKKSGNSSKTVKTSSSIKKTGSSKPAGKNIISNREHEEVPENISDAISKTSEKKKGKK